MQLRLVVQHTFELQEVAFATEALAARLLAPPPFIQPFWLLPWLKQNQDKQPVWLQCFDGDNLVASVFAVITPSQGIHSPFTCGWFNKTGDPTRDQIWIEFNDLLAEPQWHQEAVTLVLDWCKKNARDWRLEITSSPAPWLAHPGFYCDSTSIPGYAVLLSQTFADKDRFLASCSGNTRSRIRRAIKYLQAHYGDITVRDFGPNPPAEILSEMGAFHLQRWKEDPQGSGFSNPDFIAFHQALMQSDSGNPRCDILGFYAGEQCIGYTYNLLCNDKVYFYLSGINYIESSNRFQPGLVIHTYAISHYAKQAFTRYDFMGGDSQYKRSLSNHSYSLYMLRLLRKDWLTSLYQCVKTLKTQFFKRKSH